eukprot:jgi/Ulvmu1/5851/UM025_0111.1
MKHNLLCTLALLAFSQSALADSECIPLGEAAEGAGLTSLVGSITAAAPVLEGSEEGQALLAAVALTDEQPVDDQVTVFAPTNAAFDTALAALGQATPEAIAQVLLNHVVVGALTSDGIISALNADGGNVQLATLLGSEILVTGADGDIFVQSGGLSPPGATVVTPDVVTCAGPVHVIDTVLLPTVPPPIAPDGAPAPGMAPDMAPGPVVPEGACSGVDVTAEEAGLTALLNAITFASPSLPQGVLDAISAAEPLPAGSRFTVFAPTDEAFEKAAEEFGGSLPEDEQVIANVILNHIVATELTADDIIAAVGEGGGSVIGQTLLESDLYVATFGPDLFVQSRGLLPLGAQVAQADVPTCAGVVHVIDEVLLPTLPDGSEVTFAIPDMAPGMVSDMVPDIAPDMAPGPVMMAPGPGPMDMPMPAVMPVPDMVPDMAPAPGAMEVCTPLNEAASEAGLTSLVGAITAAAPALAEDIVGQQVLDAVAATEPAVPAERVTVFAPTNEAFALAAGEFGGEVPSELLPDVLLNHVVPGDLTAATILEAVGEGGGSTLVKSVGGGELFVSTVGDALYVQSGGLEAPGALVATQDVITCAGPVHVIDAVLLPTLPDGSQADLGGNLVGVPPTETRDLALPPADTEAPAEGAGEEEAAPGTEPAVATDTDAAAPVASLWAAVAAILASVVVFAA